MEIKKICGQKAGAIKITAEDNDVVAGRAFLYILYNELHAEPFGFLEDVFVDEPYRSKGVGAQLVQAAIGEAREQGCHKLICTSRYGRDGLHKWYAGFGFKEHGTEFRMDF